MNQSQSRVAQDFWKGIRSELDRRLQAVRPVKVLNQGSDGTEATKIRVYAAGTAPDPDSELVLVLASGTPPVGAEVVVATLAGGQKVCLGHVASRGGDGERFLTGEDTWTPGLVADRAAAWTSVAVAGARTSDQAVAGFDGIGAAAWMVSAHVAGPDVVRVAIVNQTGRTAALPTGTVRVTVLRTQGIGDG